MDECGGPEAKSNLESIVSQGGVGIWADTNQPDPDRYGRLLRHLTFSGGALAGEQQLLDNHAEARYDSRDGYGTHDAEDIYRSISTSPPNCTVPPRPSDDEAAVAEGNADRCNYVTYRVVKSWSKKTQRRAAYRYYKRYGPRGFSNWKAFKAACIYPETLMWIRAGIVNRKGRVVGYRNAVVEHIPASIGSGGWPYNGPRYYAPGGKTYTTSPRW